MYMNVNDTQEIAKNPNVLAMVASKINPAIALPVAVMGVLGVCLYKAFTFKKENKRLRTANEELNNEIERLEYEEFEPYDEPLSNGTPTVELTVNEPLDSMETTVEPIESSIESNVEDDEKEQLRKTMSMLGKRSAEKRRLRKERGEL